MADDSDAKVSYPYMTGSQWFGLRAKFRQSLPSVVDIDWIMAALGTSEKGARNVMPQLKAIGLINVEGRPNADLVHDFRDDETYTQACQVIRERLYPSALLSAWDNPNEDADRVAAWFMRNAGTGAATAERQAKLYLLLLKAELPAQDATSKPTKKAAPTPTRKAATTKSDDTKKTPVNTTPPRETPDPPPAGSLGPNLHIDMQIHISADASDSQIDSIFKSMAKHLYGRE